MKYPGKSYRLVILSSSRRSALDVLYHLLTTWGAALLSSSWARAPFTLSHRKPFPVTAVAVLICDFALACRFSLKRLRDQPYANRPCLRSKHARGCQV